jgi:hypothetical protein
VVDEKEWRKKETLRINRNRLGCSDTPDAENLYYSFGKKGSIFIFSSLCISILKSGMPETPPAGNGGAPYFPGVETPREEVVPAAGTAASGSALSMFDRKTRFGIEFRNVFLNSS